MSVKTKIKICGITSENEIQFLADNGVDYMGMVINCPKSKRNISLKTAEKLVNSAARLTEGSIKTVAVVVSPLIEEVYKLADIGVSLIQIHGYIPAGIADVYQKYPDLKLWKAFNGQDMKELEILRAADYVDGFVFDAAEPGSGKTFDWQSLKDIDIAGKKLILAGGLTPGNVLSAVEAVKPDVVDISSGVEFTDEAEKREAEVKYGLELALKNPDKIREFCTNVHKFA